MNMDEFFQAYATCALWSSSGPSDPPHQCENLDDLFGPEDISPECLASMRADCEDFCSANAELLAEYDERMTCECWTGSQRAGHDFWLTRNGHGAGFWDRGLGPLGDALTKAAKTYGGCDLYPGDDGKIYGG